MNGALLRKATVEILLINLSFRLFQSFILDKMQRFVLRQFELKASNLLYFANRPNEL